MADEDHPERRVGARRVRVTHIEAWIIAGIAIVAGIGAAVAHMRPTPWGPANVAWSVTGTAAVVWAGATARWWLLACAAIAVTPLASGPSVGGAVGGFAAALAVGYWHRRLPVVRALSAALTAQAVVRARLDWFHGATALLALVLALAVGLSGLSRRSRWVRRRARHLVFVLGVGVGVAILGAAVAGITAQSALTQSRTVLRQALSALRAGDFAKASTLIEQSRSQLRRGADAFERPWSVLAQAIPVVGQQVDALHRVADAGADMSEVAGSSISEIDLDSLTVRNGIVDLGAIDRLKSPMSRTYAALVRMNSAFHHRGDSWLVGPLASRLRPVADEVADLLRQTKVGLDTVEVAPGLLGQDGPRTYFVAFTTPAEARGAGGYMATWAELRVDHGRIDVTRTANTIALIAANQRPVLTLSPEYVSRWGGFGAGNGRDPVSIDFWSNITMPPDLPTVAGVIAQMYPNSGGTAIDGVITMDIPTIARFLKITGPLTVPSLDQQLTDANAAQYLLYDQYEQFADESQRDRVMAAITEQLLSAVFDGSLPGVRVMAEAIGPSITERRLTVWSMHESDQPLLHAIGIDGALPDAASTADGFAVVVNNAAGNKLDAYLRREISYTAVLDRARSRVTGTLETTLSNTVTNPDRRSPYAVGNLVGLPAGTNRMFLSVYTRLPVEVALLDGAPVPVAAQTEKGWHVSSLYVSLAPGQQRVLTLKVAGQIDPRQRYEVVAVPQPSVQPDTLRVRVTTQAGDLVGQRAGPFDALSRVAESG